MSEAKLYLDIADKPLKSLIEQGIKNYALTPVALADDAAADIITVSLEHYPKPLRIGHILADIGKQLDKQNDVRYGPLTLTEGHNLSHSAHNTALQLVEKEAQVLHSLMAARGDTLSKEDLLRDVWGYANDVESHTVETHIYRLRQKIEEAFGDAAWLRTTEDGYCLDFKD